jgi:hypothetical protein
MHNLTSAYIAIGAHAALHEAADAPALFNLLDAYGGEINLIDELCADAAMLDGLAAGARDRISGVFVYEVAEPYGTAIVQALLRNEQPDKRAIAAELLAEILIY